MVGVCKTLLFADQLVKISIVNFFPYLFRAECPDPVSQLSFRSLLPSPSYLPHGLYLHSNSLFSISTQWGTAGHFIIIINIPTPLFDICDTVVLNIIGCVIQILFCFVFCFSHIQQDLQLKSACSTSSTRWENS